jgi:hypothetical protein
MKRNIIAPKQQVPVIRPARKPREGWDAQFREMARRGDDALLDDVRPSQSTWDEEEWEWTGCRFC